MFVHMGGGVIQAITMLCMSALLDPMKALIAASGQMSEARKQGNLRLEGKEYQVQDGEIVHFRFNV